MELTICTALHCATTATIDLPIKSWSEIKAWYVKWGILHCTIDDETWLEIPLNNDMAEAVDYKRPLHVTVTDALTGETYYDDDE